MIIQNLISEILLKSFDQKQMPIYYKMEASIEEQKNLKSAETITKEKLQTLMILDYRKAIRLLGLPEQNKRIEGHAILINLLNNENLRDEGLAQLKYSLLISLAELSKSKNKIGDALFYWYESTKIGDREENFTTWLKIARNIENNFNCLIEEFPQACQFEWQSQLEHAYKQAIKVSPMVWREKVINNLLAVYKNHGKELQIADLEKLIKMGVIQDQKFFQSIYSEITSIADQPNSQTSPKLDQTVIQLRIPLYMLLQNESTPNCTFLWEYVYGLVYVLIKIANSSSSSIINYEFLSPKSLKKHEQILQKFAQLFNSDKQLRIVIINKVQNLNQAQFQASNQNMEIEEPKQQENAEKEEDRKLHEFLLDVLRYNSVKISSGNTKPKKTQPIQSTNFLQYKLIHLNKNVLYDSIYEYYKDIVTAKAYDIAALQGFQELDFTVQKKFYNSILKDIVINFEQSKIKEKIENNSKADGGQEGDNNNTPATYTRKKQQTLDLKKTEIPLFLESSTSKKKAQEVSNEYEILFKKSFKEYFQTEHLITYNLQHKSVLSFAEAICLYLIQVITKVAKISTEISTNARSSIPYFFKENSNFALLVSKCILLVNEQSNFLEMNLNLGDLQNRLIAQELIVQYIEFLALRESENKAATFENNLYSIEKQIIKLGGRTIDQIVLNKKNKILYSRQEVQEILIKIKNMVKVYSLPFLRNQLKVTALMKMYDFFQVSYQHLQPTFTFPKHSLLQTQLDSRLNKARLRQLAQQPEESALNSIDKILKSDLQTSEAIESLKIFLMNQEGQNTTATLSFFLKSFQKIMQLLFRKIESATDFPKKFISSIVKALQISDHIDVLYKKLTKDISITQKTFSLNKELATPILFYLIKVLILNELDLDHTCITFRIVFFLFEQGIKKLREKPQTQSEGDQKNPIQIEQKVENKAESVDSSLICESIIFLDSAIKAKESVDLRRKFYYRILSKAVFIIYDPKYSSTKFGQENQSDQKKQIRNKIYKIYTDAFQSKYFRPKKIEDSFGYFTLIANEFADDLEKPEVDFQPKIKRIFNECYQSFSDQYEGYMKYCPEYKKFVREFIKVMKRETKPSPDFISKTAGQTTICSCCQLPFIKQDFKFQSKTKIPRQVLFLVAKYLENKNRNQQPAIRSLEEGGVDEEYSYEYFEEERYYMDYLLLNIRSMKAWKQIVRIQVMKVYEYFDALIGVVQMEKQKNEKKDKNANDQDQNRLQKQGKETALYQPLQIYKHKFIYTKIIANFILTTLIPAIKDKREEGQILDLKEFIQYRTCLINAIKIGQRKLYCLYAKMLNYGQSRTDNEKKYIEGVIRLLQNGISSSALNQSNRLPEVQYIELIQFKYPLILDYFSTNPLSATIQRKKNSLPGLQDRYVFLRQSMRRTADLMAILTSKQIEDSKSSNQKDQNKYLEIQITTDFLIMISEIIMQVIDSFQHDSLTKNSGSTEKQAKIKHLFELSKILEVIPEYFKFQKWSIFLLNDYCIEEEGQIVFTIKQDYPAAILHFQKLQKFLLGIAKILKIIKEQENQILGFHFNKTKKSMYLRYVFMASLSLSKIYFKYGSQKISYEVLKDLIAHKSEDLLYFYHHYEKQPTQNNQILAEFYSRAIVFHIKKMEAIEHVLNVLIRQQSFQLFVLYLRKIGKMYIYTNTESKEKEEEKKQQKKSKQNPKDVSKQKITKQQKQKQGEKQQKEADEDKKDDKKKKGTKEKSKKANKEKKSQKKIRWLFVLFLRGFQIYIQAIERGLKSPTPVEIEEKYERALLQFRNKLKREAEKEKKQASSQITNIERQFANKLVDQSERVIAEYERRHQKAIKIKNAKKAGEEKQKEKEKQKQKTEKQMDEECVKKKLVGVVKAEEIDEDEENSSQDGENEIKKQVKNEEEMEIQSGSDKRVKAQEVDDDEEQNEEREMQI